MPGCISSSLGPLSCQLNANSSNTLSYPITTTYPVTPSYPVTTTYPATTTVPIKTSSYVDLSDDFRYWFTLVVTIVTSGVVSLLGIVSNVTNILVFRKQGLKDSVNISLFALAVAGLFCVTFALWSSICNVLDVLDPPGIFMVYIRKGTPNQLFITLFFICLPIINFLAILCCTVIMIVVLKSAIKWRTSARLGSQSNLKQKLLNTIPKGLEPNIVSSEPEPNPTTQCSRPNPGADTKEVRTSKLVLTVMIVFIVCNTPSNVLVAAREVVSEFQESGRLQNLYYCMQALAFLCETVNSSVNIFTYYVMSSKFKATLLSMV
ncbi:uncharacterized protein LOC131940961 [Physella acuta]|uniref:uncharacterized protein LOC131940961 n=1 Tax=Physella acuta TaxID=109671 RepID=UPI0027DEA1A5|nr:uncharacterized protein LOC131940961 [Physella acuta]